MMKGSIMLSRLLALAAASALLGAIIAHQPVTAATPETSAANAAVQYIKSLQNSDGGFPAFGADSTAGSTVDVVLALVSAGIDPTTVKSHDKSPLDYLSTQAATYAAAPGGAAKLALGLSAMGQGTASFGGVNLSSMLSANVNGTTGAYGNDMFAHVLYVLALENAHRSVANNVIEHLTSAQVSDGGWEFQPAAGTDSNTTAMALQALLGNGVSPGDAAITRGLAFLRSAQNADGGFTFVAGSDSDPNSTALAIQALVAAGESIDAGGPWDRGGHTPMAALLSFRNATTGALQFGGADSPFATYQAVPALMLAPFPDLRTRVLAAAATPTPTNGVVVIVAATPAPTSSAALPGTGAAPPGGGVTWWPLALLAAGGVAIGGAGLAMRKAR
jgi:hypothetical protein